MELEEMKQMWQQHDKALRQNKILNERIINSMLHDKSTNAIRRMMNFEYLGMAIVTIVLLVFVVMWQRADDYINVFICYLLSLIFLITAVISGIYKIQFLSATDPGGNSITETTGRIEKLRLMITRERALSLFLFPFLFILFYAVVEYWVTGNNPFDKISAHMFKLIVGITVGLACSFGVYNKIYFRSIMQIKHNLAEIEKFKNESK